MSASRDVHSPRSGPPFLRLNAWPYRLEMAGATITILALLFYGRLAVAGDLDVLATIFWFLWPDLAAFIPIGLASLRRRRWPGWGSHLYNVFHTFLVWAAVFLVWSAWIGGIAWPLLGWAAHIAMDRTFGYHLRASPK